MGLGLWLGSAGGAYVVAGGVAMAHVPVIKGDDEQLAGKRLGLPRADVDARDAHVERLGEVGASHATWTEAVVGDHGEIVGDREEIVGRSWEIMPRGAC